MTAIIIEIAAYQAARQGKGEKFVRKVVPDFDPSFWTGINCEEIGHHLRALADHVQKRHDNSSTQLAELLERYSGACFAAQHDMNKLKERLARAEKTLQRRSKLSRKKRRPQEMVGPIHPQSNASARQKGR